MHTPVRLLVEWTIFSRGKEFLKEPFETAYSEFHVHHILLTMLAGVVHHDMFRDPVRIVRFSFGSMQIGQSQQSSPIIIPVNTSIAICTSLISKPGCVPLYGASDNCMWEAEQHVMHDGLLYPRRVAQRAC